MEGLSHHGEVEGSKQIRRDKSQGNWKSEAIVNPLSNFGQEPSFCRADLPKVHYYLIGNSAKKVKDGEHGEQADGYLHASH